MKRLKKKNSSLYFILFGLLICSLGVQVHSQVLINADVEINGFRHNWDCGNDAGGWNSQPDPRYKVWVGYNAGNFQSTTSGPGLYAGCAATYGGDAVFVGRTQRRIPHMAALLRHHRRPKRNLVFLC